MRSQLFIIVLAAMLAGCALHSKKAEQLAQPAVQPRPVTLTTESTLKSSDGTRVIVEFPKQSDEPVTFFDDDTGQWAASAKLKPEPRQ